MVDVFVLQTRLTELTDKAVVPTSHKEPAKTLSHGSFKK